MSRMLAFLVRFAVIIAGYLCASLAASAFIHLLYLGSLGWTAEEAAHVVMGSLVFSIPFVALFVAYFAFIPSLVVILVAEFFGRRDWLTYALGGAIVGVAIIGLFWQGSLPIGEGLGLDDRPPVIDPALKSPKFLLLMIGSGMFAGIVYWLVAGRWAGMATTRVSRRNDPST